MEPTTATATAALSALVTGAMTVSVAACPSSVSSRVVGWPGHRRAVAWQASGQGTWIF